MAKSHNHHHLLLLLLIAAASLAGATDHIVGGHLGWNPNINYTLWSNNQTFYVGDLISFRYLKNMYTVFEVNETGYDNCTTDGAVGNWSSGKDFVPLDKPQQYYFICGNGMCQSGMKVTIKVHLLPNATPPSAAARASRDTASSAPATQIAWPVLLAAVVAMIGVGFGRI